MYVDTVGDWKRNEWRLSHISMTASSLCLRRFLSRSLRAFVEAGEGIDEVLGAQPRCKAA